MPITHVIFDCDGVLVDSEMLSAGVLMGMIKNLGLPMTDEIFRNDFLGRSFASAAARYKTRIGRDLPEDFQLQYRTRLLTEMRDHLKPMPGVENVLASLRAPCWLATSSSPQRLALSMEVTGLQKYFAARCSTASEVKHGKPAPDLLLLAARRLKADPAHCLVIEDSEMGVRAAQTAGMTVWHFAGGSHIKAGYHLPDDVEPDRTIVAMQQLGRALAEIGLC